MKIFGYNIGKMGIGTSFAIGLGAVILGPIVLPVAGNALKSLTKGAIKGGLIAYEGSKGFIAETKETIGDLAAEAKSEMSK